MVITLFRNRLRSEALEEYERWAHRMNQLASTMPGFVSIKTFAADDGERISVVEFDSEAAHGAWRNHPEHREAQRLGRERFYDEFQIQVCAPVRRYAFSRTAGRGRQD
ncbi:MAG TPA: antibiotic biosynthesis monooxygenase [Myxococcota bacterium]